MDIRHAKFDETQDAEEEGLGVAIIGISGRFPGAENVGHFWENLKMGRESISTFSVDEVISCGVDPRTASSDRYVRAGGLLEGVDLFDASLFGFTPAEAAITDPQHRLFLECAQSSLDDSGYGDASGILAGVYAGAGLSGYFLSNLRGNPTAMALGELQAAIGNESSYLTTVTSYKLNLCGPSVGVQTACSTSLVAVHMACQGLISGDCDLAVAGGVSIDVPAKRGYLYETDGILSPDGHCRPFDARARGTVFGSGVGAVVLKRLDDAIADGDSIRAVIRGSAINNDGSQKVGFTAPSVNGQMAVIRAAHVAAEVHPSTIQFVEAHGTGTSLGDPIEMSALSRAFGLGADAKKSCAVGSVKSVVGHLNTAAGIASLIKVVLSLQNKLIPPSAYFEEPNPEIDFEHGPFYVNRDPVDWPIGSTRRRAAVSSFGIGGTNAHVILEEPPPRLIERDSRKSHLLLLSAATKSALVASQDELGNSLNELKPDLGDVALTLGVGRREYRHRIALVCGDPQDGALMLSCSDQLLCGEATDSECDLAFMFPGVGEEYPNMGRALYEQASRFREEVQRGASFLLENFSMDISDQLFPITTELSGKGDVRSIRSPVLREAAGNQPNNGPRVDPALVQCSLFVFEWALACQLIDWGIYPKFLIGYSLGEYVCATVSRVFSFEDGLRLVAARGKMISGLQQGAMLTARASEQTLRSMSKGEVWIAGIIGESTTVVSGSVSDIAALQAELRERRIAFIPVQTSRAFHSELMRPIAQQLSKIVRELKPRPPEIPYVSNLTGRWIEASEATDPEYWVRQTCEPVQFVSGLELLFERTPRIGCLEVGPGQFLSSVARQRAVRESSKQIFAIPCVRRREDTNDDHEFLLRAVGHAWAVGGRVDRQRLFPKSSGGRIPLPGYSYDRERYWVESNHTPKLVAPVPQHQKGEDPDGWFYRPNWTRRDLPRGGASTDDVLLFADDAGYGDEAAGRLARDGVRVILVRMAAHFEQFNDGEYGLAPSREADYEHLARKLADAGVCPTRVVHFWTVGDSETRHPGHGISDVLNRGFLSLAFIVRGLRQVTPAAKIDLTVITETARQVSPHDAVRTEWATVFGACLVIPQEYTGVRVRSIDIGPGASFSWLSDELAADISSTDADRIIAYRDGKRWIQDFERFDITLEEGAQAELRRHGVYLITGGLGKIGYVLASYLASAVQARLVLVGRTGLSTRKVDGEAEEHGEATRRMGAIKELEKLGSEVLVCSADVRDEYEMTAVVARAEEQFGRIDGVIHAAGVPMGGNSHLLAELTAETIFEGISVKVDGVRALEVALGGRDLDFRILIGSLSSVLGGLSFSAYAAANCYLDAFAESRAATKRRWTSVAWPEWRHGSESSGSGAPSVRATVISPVIDDEDGVAAFRRILSRPQQPRVIVSTRDLKSELRQFAEIFCGTVESSRHIATTKDRPEIAIEYSAPRDAVERSIAEVWERLLGMNRVGIHDDFLDLGGNSLLGVQILNQLQDMYGIEISLRALFDSPTIAGLACEVGRGAAEEDTGAWHPASDRSDDSTAAMTDYLEKVIAGAVGINREELSGYQLPTTELDPVVADVLLALRRDHGFPAFPNEIVAHRTLESLAGYLVEEIAEHQNASGGQDSNRAADCSLHEVRRNDSESNAAPALTEEVVFLLSAPRSGSTLLRAMLGGHPELFCPPELFLLEVDSLGEWRDRLDSPLRRGLERAIREALGVTTVGAAGILVDWITRNVPV